MDNKLIMISIAAVIGIIVLGSVLMPILDDATDTHDTFTNTGLYHMEKIDESRDFVLKWEYASPNQVTLDGETIALSQGGYPLTILFTEDIMLRVTYGASCDALGATDDLGATTLVGGSVAGSVDLTVTASSGTLTLTNGTDTKTYDTSAGMIISSDGPYVMKNYNTTAYMDGDTEFYVAGYTYRALGVAYTNFVGIFSGTINGGIDPISYVPSTYTISDPTFTYTAESDKYTDFYDFSGFSIGLTDGTNSGTVTYTQLIVPVEVDAELSQHLTPGQNELLGVIPVMIIVAVLLGVVALVLRSRMD